MLKSKRIYLALITEQSGNLQPLLSASKAAGAKSLCKKRRDLTLDVHSLHLWRQVGASCQQHAAAAADTGEQRESAAAVWDNISWAAAGALVARTRRMDDERKIL